MKTQNILKNTASMDTYPHELSRKEKNRKLSEKPFSKDNFDYDYEMMTYICPLGQPLYKKSEYQYKNKTRITHQTKECKNYPTQE